MIVDASALLAILLEEPEAQSFRTKLAAAPHLRMSAVNALEVFIRADRRARGAEADQLLRVLSIVIEAADEGRVRAARIAHCQYGVGRHPARLNLGDCFAYALSQELGEPLLFKGRDFALTDVSAA